MKINTSQNFLRHHHCTVDKGVSNKAELKGPSGSMARESYTATAGVSGDLSRTLSELHHVTGRESLLLCTHYSHSC